MQLWMQIRFDSFMTRPDPTRPAPASNIQSQLPCGRVFHRSVTDAHCRLSQLLKPDETFPTQMARLAASSGPSPSIAPALLRHPLSSPSSRPSADDIANSWVLEFVLRQPIPNQLAHEIFLSLPFSSFHPRLRKTLLLHRLAAESQSCSLSERTLHSLELIEEHDRVRGAAPSERLKDAYCAVAVDCTAAALRRGVEDFADAVKRIWKARIADIKRSEAAVGLVSEELIEWANRMEQCSLSAEGGEELFGKDMEDGMRLVKDYLNEAMEELGPSFLEIAAAEVKENMMSSRGSACKVGKVKDANQCVGKLETMGKWLEDDGIDKKCEGLGDVCMWGLDDDGVLERSSVLEDVSTKDLEDDRIIEESRDPNDASTEEGHGCYGAEGFKLNPVVGVDEQGCVNHGGHDTSDPGGGLIHKLNPIEVYEVKEALKNSRLELQMLVEDPLPEAEAAAAAALISISAGNAFLNGLAKHSSRGNGVLPDSVIELAADVPAGLAASADALVKEKCNLVPLPDTVNREPSESKRLEESGIVEEYNKDAEPSKHKDGLVHHALFERNTTGYSSELSDVSSQSRQLCLIKSTDLQSNPKTRRTSLPGLDRRLGKRRSIKRWTLLEENTLREAVAKHGRGNWKLILSCNAKILQGRTEVDLKDKWRNMSRYLMQV